MRKGKRGKKLKTRERTNTSESNMKIAYANVQGKVTGRKIRHGEKQRKCVTRRDGT